MAGTTTRSATAQRRMTARLAAQFAGGLALAHFLSVTELLVAVLALSGRTPGGTHLHFTEKNVITAVALALAGTVAVALAER